jgi:hypothetical protein
MAALPVIATNLDYESDLEKIKEFLSNAKGVNQARRGGGRGITHGQEDDQEDADQQEEGDDEDEQDEALVDMLHMGLNGGNGRATGLKYKDAMVSGRASERASRRATRQDGEGRASTQEAHTDLPHVTTYAFTCNSTQQRIANRDQDKLIIDLEDVANVRRNC